MSNDYLTSTLQAAEQYAAQGLVVIPLEGKRPYWKNWQKKAVAEGIAEIRRLARAGKLHNIGVVAGRNSGNLFQFEIDGLELYNAAIGAIPELRDTFTILSGGGNGAHIYGRAHTLPATTAARQPGEHLEARFKGEGQQCVAPPSIHPETGNEYKVLVSAPIRLFEQSTIDAILAFIDARRPAPGVTFKPKEQPRRPTSAPATLEDEVAEALSYIPLPLPYDGSLSWISILAALKSEFGDATAVKLAEAWSGHCSKPGEIEAKIASFTGSYQGTPATIASVFHLAKQYGYERPRPRKRTAQIRQRDIATPAAPSNGAKAVRYVSDDLPPHVLAAAGDVLIIAPTGLGKSRAAADYAKTKPADCTITAIAQFRLLTIGLSAVMCIPHYEDADGTHQRALAVLPQLVSSVSSLYKFERKGGLWIIDEIEGVLDFLASSSTFTGNGTITAYRAFKAGVRSAEQVVGMDANLSDIAITWLEKQRGKVTVKRYQSAQERGKVTFLRDFSAGVYMLDNLLNKRQGQVYVPCSSEADASTLYDRYKDEYRVIKITRDTANTPAVQAFIRSPEARGEYDLVIYTSAMGAGVDISEPVYARVGFFLRSPLAPEQAIQIYGRVRNARLSYAVVPPHSEGYSTPSASEILGDWLKREVWTAARTGRPADITGDYLEIAELAAQFKARRMRETAQWRMYFAQRLKQNGYKVQANNAKAPPAFAEMLKDWRKQRRDDQWGVVLNAVEQALPDEELDALRIRGVEITTDLKLRNVRYRIEGALGHDDLKDADRDLVDERGRRRLFRLRDLFTETTALIDSDRAQAEEGRALQKRRYHALNQGVIAKLLRCAEFEGTVEKQFLAFAEYFKTERSRTDLEARFAVFTTPEALSLFEALGHRGNNARTAHGLCRWLIEYVGLKLNSRQRRIDDGSRQMFYQADAEVLAYRLERARRAAQVREGRLSKNVHSPFNNTFLDSSAKAEVQHKPPLLFTRQSSPTVADMQALGQRLIDLHQKLHGGATS